MRSRRSTAFWLESGFVTRIGSHAAAASPSTPDSAATGQLSRSSWSGGTSAWVTTSVRPAPDSTSRSWSRTSSGDGRYGGIGVWGSEPGISS